MTSMSHQPHHLHQLYRTMTTSSWPSASQVSVGGHNHHAYHHQSEGQYGSTLAAPSAYSHQHQQMDPQSGESSTTSGADLATVRPNSQSLTTADKKSAATESHQQTSPETTASTPISGEHQSLSPVYGVHQQQHQANKIATAATTPTLKSPQMVDHRHYQADTIYQNRFFGQQHHHQHQQQQSQVSATHYYEPATSFAQDQDQYSNGSAICMQQTHQPRHPFGASWSAPATVAVNTLFSPHQVAVSPQLGATSPPVAALGNQHFHHQHHQQQSGSPYSHHHATNYTAATATNGYGIVTSQLASSMAQPAHRHHGEPTAPSNQHFIGQQQAPPPPPPHQHTQHPHQHYHQPVTQVQSQQHPQDHQQQQQQQHQINPHHHHNHHQSAEQLMVAPQVFAPQAAPHQQQNFYNQQQTTAYYQQQQQQPQQHHHQFHHSHQSSHQQQNAANLRINIAQQQQQNNVPQKHASGHHQAQLVAKNYSSMSPKGARNQHQHVATVMSNSEQMVRANSVASSLSSSSPKLAGINMLGPHSANMTAGSPFQHSTGGAMIASSPLQKAAGVAGQYCRRQSVSVVSTTSSATSSASGEQQTGSPVESERSPMLLKQHEEQSESRIVAMHNEQLDQSKKESQLEQLHQQCANLLEEHQRVSLTTTTGGAAHLLAGSQQQDAKRATNDTNAANLSSGGQTPTTGNNNNNGNPANGRSKRLRTSFKHNQLKEMKKWFSKNQNPDAKDLKTLAQTTGLSKRVLQVWFQNARAKYRRNNAKAAKQQLYSVNQHTSQMLQYQQEQQQQQHHHHQTYGQQHHLSQHSIAGHHHHHHHHHHQQEHQQQHNLHGPSVTTANATNPIGMPSGIEAPPSDHTGDHTNQQPTQPPARAHDDGSQLVPGDGSISSFVPLNID